MADSPESSAEDETKLGFRISAETARRLFELQQSVRDAGHAKPSQRTLISALVQRVQERGEDLEREVLVPFRLAHPEED
jgi:hypothetical protein